MQPAARSFSRCNDDETLKGRGDNERGMNRRSEQESEKERETLALVYGNEN